MFDALLWILIAVALASLAAMRWGYHLPARATFIVAISAAAALAFARWGPAADIPARQVSWSCAGLALIGSIAAAFRRRMPRRAGDIKGTVTMAPLLRLAALLFGVIAFVIESVILMMRAAFAVVDALHGYPSAPGKAYGFSKQGLWSIGLLLAAALVSLVATSQRRLVAGTFILALMGSAWASLLLPSFTIDAVGGHERAGGTISLMLSWSVLMLATNLVIRNVDTRRRWRLATVAPTELPSAFPFWPGLRLAFGFAVIVIAWSACYHLLVPIRGGAFGYRAAVLASFFSTIVAAIACARLLVDGRGVALAECVFGLFSLALCAAAVLLLPEQKRPLVERYPMIFNAMMVGLALAAALWTWLSQVWLQQLDGGKGWTIAGRLIPMVERHAFLAAALAWVSGVVMMVWPRLSTVATADDSFGRVTAGVGGNLLLLLVTLWSARKLHRPSFRILTAMVVLSTGGFLLVRMLPYRSYVG